MGIVTVLPAIEGLRADAEVAASEAGIVPMGVTVIKPFQSLPGLPRQLRDACQASVPRQDAAIHTHSAAIIAPFHLLSCVTHLSERDQALDSPLRCDGLDSASYARRSN